MIVKFHLHPLVATLCIAISCGANATNNIIRLGAPVNNPNETWLSAPSTYSEWMSVGEIFGCVNWVPDANGIMTSQTLAQQSTDCQVNQERYKQNREQSSVDGEIRNVGEPTLETRLGNASADRDYTVAYSTWSDSGSLYGCSNWSPDPETITWGEAFTQEATDCKQNQQRSRTDSYVDSTGTPVSMSKGLSSQTLLGLIDRRSATGQKDGWISTDATYTDWVSSNELYACGVWLPSPASVSSSQTFTQQALDCKTDQQRFKQARDQQLSSQEYRDVGTPVAENKTLTSQTASRSYTVTLGSWANNGAKYACTNWTPDPTTVAVGVSFTQTATDCKADQTRTRAESYVDHKSGGTVQVSAANESKTLTAQTETRSSTGTKETWAAATPSYTTWVNTNTTYNCSVWSPAGSTKTASGTFVQTAADCKTDQTRNRQDREQESTTLAYRNVGTPVVENQTLTSQTATRNYTVAVGSWTNTGAKYSCSNWSPAPSTVAVGTSFTQTATDCKQDQTRTRSESYVDHRTGSTVAVTVPADTQTLTAQTSTQSATGTKETWAAATPTYTTWTNTNALYNCAVWSPAASTMTATGSFTQTASDCKTDQTRTRQDREQETTTLAYRNKGTAVTESQTLTSQTASRNYTVTLGAWTNSGDLSGCSNWSPDPSTVNSGTSFTQTATDCSQSQVRTRAESYLDHLSGAAVAVNVPNESKVLTGQSNTRSATGTKGPSCYAETTSNRWVTTLVNSCSETSQFTISYTVSKNGVSYPNIGLVKGGGGNANLCMSAMSARLTAFKNGGTFTVGGASTELKSSTVNNGVVCY